MLADVADQVRASDAIHLAVAIQYLDGGANLVNLGRSPLAAERGLDEGGHRVGVRGKGARDDVRGGGAPKEGEC